MTPEGRPVALVEAVVFDMDGILFDTEHLWHEIRHNVAHENGGHWDEDDQRAVMGMNSLQWAAYMHDRCEVRLEPEAIFAEVVGRLRVHYRDDPPEYPGAREAVRALADRFKLGVASSSPLELIETAVQAVGLTPFFATLISSDLVARGKPEPDVYLAACAGLDVAPSSAAAVEDSTNGIRAAVAAGLTVIAIPNAAFPPAREAVGLARRTLASISELTVEVVETLGKEAVDG